MRNCAKLCRIVQLTRNCLTCTKLCGIVLICMEFRGIRGLSNQLLSACAGERISQSRYWLHSSEERCIAHELSYRGIASKTLELHKTGTPSSVCLSWKKEYNLWWVYKPCKMIMFFYSNGCLDWSTVEDSTW